MIELVFDDAKREDFRFEVGLLAFVVEVVRIDEDETVRGVEFCGGVARPITGGGVGVDVAGLVEGVGALSQDEKKSSSSFAAALVSADDVISGMPSTYTRVGNLWCQR